MVSFFFGLSGETTTMQKTTHGSRFGTYDGRKLCDIFDDVDYPFPQASMSASKVSHQVATFPYTNRLVY